MVNASLNWASIVGIVLAVGGAFLYFMRNFKPALARDYDVFFAAIGLLCGGILFFQGWRLDPILQFGQFLLAGTTVFFAYESVRLRGVTTEQARRSSYFDDDEPAPFAPRGGFSGRSWEGESFDEPDRSRQRIRPRDEVEDDFYRPRRPASRAAIPERAISRRIEADDWDERGGVRREAQGSERDAAASRYTAGAGRPAPADFGARRRGREEPEARRGSRPVASSEGMPRSSRRSQGAEDTASGSVAPGPAGTPGMPQGSPLRANRADNPRSGAGGSSARPGSEVSDAEFAPLASRPSQPRPSAPAGSASGGPSPAAGAPYSRSERSSAGPGTPAPRDNSSRFDD
ncbi:MAG: Ycf66 family protein [Cyanobium sp.]